MKDKKCGDSLFNSLVDEASDWSSSNHSKYLLCVLFLSVAFLGYILFLLTYFCRGKDKKSEYQKELSDSSSSSSSEEEYS